MMLNLLHKLGLPIATTAHGESIYQLLGWVHWLMGVLFIGWMAFFVQVLWSFRAGKHPKADYHGVKSHISTYAEVAVIVAEAILLLAFSIPMWSQRVHQFPSPLDSVVVEITAEQFAWNIHYPGPDGVFGKSDPKLIDLQSNPLGLDFTDPHAQDDITNVNQMHLPVNKNAIIYLKSKDVIHCFNVPNFVIKQDVIPGQEIPIWFKPTLSTEALRDKLGRPDYNYEIACAQLCGNGHSSMKGYVTVESQDAFDVWLKSQAPKPVAKTESKDAGFWQ